MSSLPPDDNNPERKKKQGERNPSASLQQKLRNHAKATGEEVALVLIRYLNERFLYRLSVSPYRDRFVLRGATLFTVWDKEPHRATCDIDVLASGDNSVTAMRQTVEAICARLENKCPLEDVQKTLGHVDSHTTKLYDKRGDNPECSATFLPTTEVTMQEYDRRDDEVRFDENNSPWKKS